MLSALFGSDVYGVNIFCFYAALNSEFPVIRNLLDPLRGFNRAVTNVVVCLVVEC